jgi:polar amino acid transport system substrate-binding protein
MEFDKSEYTVVVANGESGDIFVKDNFKNAKIDVIDVEAGDILGFLSAVSTKRADVGIISSMGGADFAKEHPEVRDVFAKDPFSLNPAAYAVRQDDLKFLNFLNNVLSMMEVKGLTRQFEKKYDAEIIYKKEQFVPSGQ